MSIHCEFCGKEFNKKSNLERHKKITKKCLEIQRLGGEKKFMCSWCYTELSSKRNLKSHYVTCVNYNVALKTKELSQKNQDLTNRLSQSELKNNKYIKLKESYKELELQLVNKEKNITKLEKKNTKLQKQVDHHKLKSLDVKYAYLKPIDRSEINTLGSRVPVTQLRNGGKSLANFAYTFILRGKVVCTDLTRETFIYKNKEGEVKIDPFGYIISRLFFKKFFEMYEYYYPEVLDHYTNSGFNEDDFNKHYNTKLKDAEYIMNGKMWKLRTSLYTDFVKELCRLVYSRNGHDRELDTYDYPDSESESSVPWPEDFKD